jgi:hypothetical protein
MNFGFIIFVSLTLIIFTISMIGVLNKSSTRTPLLTKLSLWSSVVGIGFVIYVASDTGFKSSTMMLMLLFLLTGVVTVVKIMKDYRLSENTNT